MTTFLELAARNAVGAALLAALVLLASLLVKRPAVRHALWLIVLVRLLMPPIWNVPIPGVPAPEAASVLSAKQPRSAVPAQDFAPRHFENASQANSSPVPASEISDRLPARPELNPREPQARDAGSMPASAFPEGLRINSASTNLAVAEHRELHQDSAVAAPNADLPKPQWFLPGLLVVWGGGSLFVALLAWQRIRRFQSGLRDAIPAPSEMQEQAEQIARRLGLSRAPAVWLAPGRIPPMVWMPGLSSRHARLIFPTELFFRLDGDQRGSLMAHELAHLKRLDPWVRWLELLSTVLYWWHPMLGLIRRRLRDSEEQCCDGWVVAHLPERKAYATALVETVMFLDQPTATTPHLASGAGPVNDLKRRLVMIMRGGGRGRLTRFGVLAMLGVATAALAFGPAFSQDLSRDKAHSSPRKIDGDAPTGGNSRSQGNGGEPSEIEKARDELENARRAALEADGRLRAAEARWRQLTSTGTADTAVPGTPAENALGLKPLTGAGAANTGTDRQLQEMQRQLDEMRKLLEQLRREVRNAPPVHEPPFRKGPGDFGPKGPGEHKDFRRFPGGLPGAFPGRPGGRGPHHDGDRERLPQPREKQ